MSDLLRKLGVVLTSLPGWLAAATAVLTIVATEVVPLLPANWPVAGWVATALALLAAAGAVVARLTPVEPSERGVLPK